MNSSVSIAALALLLTCVCASAQSPNDATTPADNSKANQSDAHLNESADAQKNDKTDISLTRNIRRSLMADKSLSTYAHNVKIVSVDGTVTLNGVVRSNDEKASVQAKAITIAGQGHVVNQMTVAPPRS